MGPPRVRVDNLPVAQWPVYHYGFANDEIFRHRPRSVNHRYIDDYRPLQSMLVWCHLPNTGGGIGRPVDSVEDMAHSVAHR